jgi:hemerythrin-like metal-binding protein
MSLFRWSDEHSVYLPELDAEHRGLFRLGAEVHKGILAGRNVDQLKPTLLSLLEAAEEHFHHEERLMRAVHYPAFQWHRRQHDTVRKKAKQLLTRMEAGNAAAPMELIRFLDSWLVGHMSISDRMMGAFLRNYLRFNTALAS